MDLEKNSNDDEKVNAYLPLLFGYAIAALLVGIYFVIKGIKENYFDCICISFVCLPYCVADFMIGIKKANNKKIVFNIILIIIMLIGAIYSYIHLLK